MTISRVSAAYDIMKNQFNLFVATLILEAAGMLIYYIRVDSCGTICVLLAGCRDDALYCFDK